MTERRAKIKCPHCGQMIIVRDKPKNAAIWKAVDKAFAAVDRAFEEVDRLFRSKK
jgi:DNA-directed RNA polymerase subunit RPC12/RpoP